MESQARLLLWLRNTPFLIHTKPDQRDVFSCCSIQVHQACLAQDQAASYRCVCAGCELLVKQQATGVCAGCELLVKQQATGVCAGCELLVKQQATRMCAGCELLDQAAS